MLSEYEIVFIFFFRWYLMSCTYEHSWAAKQTRLLCWWVSYFLDLFDQYSPLFVSLRKHQCCEDILQEFAQSRMERQSSGRKWWNRSRQWVFLWLKGKNPHWLFLSFHSCIKIYDIVLLIIQLISIRSNMEISSPDANETANATTIICITKEKFEFRQLQLIQNTTILIVVSIALSRTIAKWINLLKSTTATISTNKYRKVDYSWCGDKMEDECFYRLILGAVDPMHLQCNLGVFSSFPHVHHWKPQQTFDRRANGMCCLRFSLPQTDILLQFLLCLPFVWILLAYRMTFNVVIDQEQPQGYHISGKFDAAVAWISFLTDIRYFPADSDGASPLDASLSVVQFPAQSSPRHGNLQLLLIFLSEWLVTVFILADLRRLSSIPGVVVAAEIHESNLNEITTLESTL